MITLRDFYVNLSVTWIGGGVVGSIFTNVVIVQKLIYTMVGLSFGILLLKLALDISKILKKYD